MRALFLGSNGRVGSLLKAAWTRTDVKPIWHGRSDGDLTFDILNDGDALKSAISTCDVVVNLAGATHHGAFNVGSANTALAKAILDNTGETPVFLISSAAIYGTATGPLSEHFAPTPISDYGRDKAAMEALAKDHPSKSTVLRLGNVAGADALLGVARDRYQLDQFADGSYPRRSYIGPNQLADTLADLIVNYDKLPQTLNVAAARATSMRDLLDAADKPWDDQRAGPDAIAKVELDTALLEAITPLPETAHDAITIVEDWRSVRTSA